MPTSQEQQELNAVEQLRGQLRGDEDLLVQLGNDSQELERKERAAKELQLMTEGRPEDAADYRRATQAVGKLAGQRAALEVRIKNARWRVDVAKERIARYDLPKLNRAANVNNLMQRLAGV